MIRRRFLGLSTALLLVYSNPFVQAAEAAGKYTAENVLIVVLDGVRWSESWGDPQHTYIPKLAELSKQGAVFTNFRNNGTTSTNPGHASLMTGHREKIANDGSDFAPHPTFMQLWRKQTGAPQEAACVVTAKGKLAILADSEDPQWKGTFTATMDSGVDGGGLNAKTRSDRDTFAALKRILAEKHPRTVLVNFAAPDARGHAGDKEAYLAAIKEADGYVGELWTLLQKDPFYAGKTALFVTNDHGRHLDGVHTGFKDHGCDCEGCRHIMLFACGPDFKQGVELNTPREQIDVPVTAAELLGVKIPESKGQVMSELFAAREGRATTTSGCLGGSPWFLLALTPSRPAQ